MAPPEELPADVLRFLDGCIDSVEQLNVLLLLHSDPKRFWSLSEITLELRSSESSIKKRLEALYARKVLAPNPESPARFRYAPFAPEVSELIDRLAEQNALKPCRAIESIYLRPSKALIAFADAFTLRGPKS